MLSQYISECMGIDNQHHNGIKEPTRGYQDCNTSQVVILGGLSKCENLCIPIVIIWVNVMLN